MKRAILAATLAVMALAAAWSQPRIAVLDAIIPQNMDPSVVVPVTEKVAERLVVSGRFIVLDRANIESVLKEREFEMSGMVTDQDVVTAGKYLGADFVVAVKVTKIADTYFISAKMINIKTGVIANQTSAQGEGKLSTLIDLASQVGEVLSGGAVTAVSSTGEQKDISKPSGTTTGSTSASTGAGAQPGAPKPKEKLKTHLVVSGGFTSGVISNSSWTSDITGSGGGFDAHMLLPLFGGLSAVANVDDVSFTDSVLTDYTETFVDLMGGVGYALKLGAFVPFVAVKGGVTFADDSKLGSSIWSDTGGCFGLDLGSYFDIGKSLTVGIRYQYTDVSVDFDGVTGGTVALSSFFISAGFRF
jgi:hypothetical protein